MNTAELLFARLTEVEKIRLRMAADGAIEQLAHDSYGPELKNMGVDLEQKVATIATLRDMAHAEFAAPYVPNGELAFGKTWKF